MTKSSEYNRRLAIVTQRIVFKLKTGNDVYSLPFADGLTPYEVLSSTLPIMGASMDDLETMSIVPAE